jgi:hypothetical protein
MALASGTLFFIGVSTADAGGDKNRLGDEDITEGYQLCQQGVESVTITEVDEDGSGTVVVIDCDEIPGPEFDE